MTTLPVMRTWVAGALVTAADMNSNVRDAGNFLLARPLAHLRQTAAQSIPNGAVTPILWDTEDLDRDNGHSTVTNTSRYTAQTPGYYWTSYTLPWAASAAGRRYGRLRTNGTDTSANALSYSAQTTPGAALAGGVTGGGVQYLNGTTDYIELCAFQDSGGALGLYVGIDAVPRFSLLWVSS